MEVKFLKDFRGKETNEFFFRAGEIGAVKDHFAERLIDMGVAEEWKGDSGVVFESLEPVIAPDVQFSPTATGKAAALVEKDNEAVIRNLREELKAEEEAGAPVEVLPVVEVEPEAKPEPKAKSSKKAKK